MGVKFRFDINLSAKVQMTHFFLGKDKVVVQLEGVFVFISNSLRSLKYYQIFCIKKKMDKIKKITKILNLLVKILPYFNFKCVDYKMFYNITIDYC